MNTECSAAANAQLLAQLDQLRVELIDLACALDRRGQHEAADVAMVTAARLEELRTAPVP